MTKPPIERMTRSAVVSIRFSVSGRRCVPLAGLVFGICLSAAASLWAQSSLARLEQSLPLDAAQFDAQATRAVALYAGQTEAWFADQTWQGDASSPDRLLETLTRLIDTRQRVDRLLTRLLDLRGTFAEQQQPSEMRAAIQHYLAVTSQLIDLSGRLRYLLKDALDQATYDLDPDLREFQRLIALLTAKRVEVAPELLAYVLFDPPADSPDEPYPDEIKQLVLRLFAACAQPEDVIELADFLAEPNVNPELALLATEVLRQIGLPQDPHPSTPADVPPPAITAARLQQHLLALRFPPLRRRQLEPRRQELLSWLEQRIRSGIQTDSFRLGSMTLQSGDWLLMRNPSPYNRFTDLSPGLFTHVGIVAAETGDDGRRRFVIVDLPERGEQLPATNVEVYLERTLHYVFLRHQDNRIAEGMGDAAGILIGNESLFDLNFRTDRLEQLQEQPLESVRLHTYCAGLLLYCGMRAGAERTGLFPFVEYPTNDVCRENLKRLGLSFGDDFLSPTGALYSRQFQLVGRRNPMYDPGREIHESIYDHFAQRMAERPLDPSPDLAQQMVQALAQASRSAPWLARAMARAGGVHERMDLESAAKTAAVVQTLDQIADDHRRAFFLAWEAVRSLPVEQLSDQQLEADQRKVLGSLQRAHATLMAQWQQERISPRQLRIELVEYYQQRGRSQVDQRFFPTSAAGD